MDKWAADTFSFNHPGTKVLTRDIQMISDAEITDAFGGASPDIVLGGPPCQGYSICCKNAGDPTDPKNSLFTEFLRVARILSPEFVLMENVPNIERARTHSGELVIDIIKEELRKLGYQVAHRVLEATNYGVPQIRKRLFIIGSLQGLTDPFPEATHSTKKDSLFTNRLKPCPTLWDSISDLPPLKAGEGAEEQDYCLPPVSAYQKQLRKDCQRLCNHKAMNHTSRMVERFASMSWGQSVSDVAEHLRPFRRNGNGELSGKAYDQNNRRMHPQKPCHTIPASFYANFVHPYQSRNFTPREGARIQSFPDQYVFKGKPTVISQKLLSREGRIEEKHLCQYAQIGNAVPPLMAQAIAENLMRQHRRQFVYESTR